MDPREKLRNIQEQKKKLQERLVQIDNSQIIEDKGNEMELRQLLLRKKMLQQQKRKQEQYKKMQIEYNSRKKQAQRQRQLQKIKNEKRIIELQAAMKKVVFEGIKQKVKGMNSQQLMIRGYLSNGDEINKNKNKQQSDNFKDVFESYLMKQGGQKIRQKYNLNNLNEKRLQIYEKKQQMVMKQILLKQLTATDDQIEIDVINMTKQQLIIQLNKRNINIDDYMHPIKKQDIIQHYDIIKNQAKQRILQKRKDISNQKLFKQNYQKYIKKLREQVHGMSYKSVQVVKRLLYDLFDEVCDQYDKRHVNRSKQDQEQISKKLQEQYDQLWNNNLVDELSHSIIDNMMLQIRRQMIKQSGQQIYKINQYAHQKTQDCFKLIFGDGDIGSRLQQLNNYKINLNFIDESQNHINKPKNEQYIKKLDKNDNNIYETQQNTVNLINDIILLSQQQKYIKNIKNIIKNQIQNQYQDSIFYYQISLYSINKYHIQQVYNHHILYSFQQYIDSINHISKLHTNWIISSDKLITFINPWNREDIGNIIGSRISNPCGNITYVCIYPVLTLLGGICSIFIGFQKGQILKYNYNLNRITSKQINLTQYIPIIEHAKTGDQPAFPLDNRDYIAIQQEKAKANDEIHQFRQFFEHHVDPIIFIQFYRVDKMISIDKGLKCALWQYSKSRGVSTFEPIFKFEIRSSYQIFKQDQNPRYRDIYPISTSKQTPQQMYQKYMMTQAFLKLQLYNNPKKQMAYFKSSNWDKQQSDKPIWKITYKDNKKQINKILQSYYNVIDGSISCQQAKIVRDNVYILCERQHVIRNDLKTIKLYSWSIQQKRLGRVGIQIDMYKDQKVSNFIILPNLIKGLDIQMAVIVNSGRILLFSLVSGQLLRNLNDQLINLGKQNQKYYFKNILYADDRQYLYGISNNSIMQIHTQDNNSINQRNKLNKIIDNVKRKFFR